MLQKDKSRGRSEVDPSLGSVQDKNVYFLKHTENKILCGFLTLKSVLY